MVEARVSMVPEVSPFDSTSKVALALPPAEAPSINQTVCEYGPRWFAARLWPRYAGLRAASSVKLTPDSDGAPRMRWYDSPINKPPTGGL